MNAAQVQYYNERWRQFSYANFFGEERCIFFSPGSFRDAGPTAPNLRFRVWARWLTGILSAFGPTVGVELSLEAVELAQSRYPVAQFICADATKWDPEPGSFDVVVSQEVIEHIPDKPAYLQVARRALKTGGYLFMTTPNLRVLESTSKLERETIWEIQPIELPLRRAELTALLQKSGFQVMKTGSVVYGIGHFGIDRLVNSHKLRMLLRSLRLEERWLRFLLKHDFGLYLTTVARAV